MPPRPQIYSCTRLPALRSAQEAFIFKLPRLKALLLLLCLNLQRWVCLWRALEPVWLGTVARRSCTLYLERFLTAVFGQPVPMHFWNLTTDPAMRGGCTRIKSVRRGTETAPYLLCKENLRLSVFIPPSLHFGATGCGSSLCVPCGKKSASICVICG